nr:hypothetical protein [Desulfobulbaceae bacterium]
MSQLESERCREFIVEPANSWKESAWVLVVVAFLLLLAFARVAFLPEAKQNLSLQPYQRLDTTLTDLERPIYQAFLSSQNEIIMPWQDSGSWPDVELLNSEAIPPFALDFMPGDLRSYSWVKYDRGPWVDYWGTSASKESSLPSAILRVINLHADFHPHPHPGKDYDPDQQAAVQIWIHPESGQRYPGMRLAEQGWFWIVSPSSPVLIEK